MTERNPPAARSGFSLIEVALALMIAGSGLLAAFGLFPHALRTSAEARDDMKAAAFADTILQTIAGNVRQIDEISVWNDPAKWWAVASYGLEPKGGWWSASPSELAGGSSNFADSTANEVGLAVSMNGSSWKKKPDGDTGWVQSPDASSKLQTVFYYGKEYQAGKVPAPPSSLANMTEQAQYLLRVSVVTRPARHGGRLDVSAGRLPNRYSVSVVSSVNPRPSLYTNGHVFTQEYFFVHRP